MLQSAAGTAAAAADATSSGVSDEASADLEMDELNQHECMSSLVSLLRHMHTNNIMPTVLQVCNNSKHCLLQYE